MTLDDLIAGLFPTARPMQPEGQTPNDLIMSALGGIIPRQQPGPALGVPRADSFRVAQGVSQPVASNPAPAANPAPAQTSSQQSPMAQTVPEPGVFDRLGALSEGYHQTGLLGGIANAFTAPDAAVKAKRDQLAATNNTYQVLTTRHGFAPDEAMMLVRDPKLLNEVLTSRYKQPERELKEIFNEKTGRKQLASIDKNSGGYIPVGGTEAGGEAGGFKDVKERASIEEGLRKEVSSLTKDWNTVRDAHAKIEAISSAPPSPAGDMGLVFGIMKMYDPNSVVRETEYATAKNAAGVPDIIMNTWNKLKDGQFLTSEQRADFVAQADTLAHSQAKRTKQVLEQYQGVGERLGVDTRNVILDDPDAVGRIGERPPPPGGIPKVGAVMDGYRFKGGNPGDPNSWERAQ